MSKYFSPFVIPFCIGVVLLFAICIWKYIRWYRGFDRLQRAIIRKNIFSWKFLPAIWEIIMESLMHRRIFKRNFMLGYMHASIAFGWFLLIVVGFFEAELGIHGSKPFWVAIFYRFFQHDHNTFASAAIFTQVMDGLLLFVLSGIAIAFVKMIYSRIVGMKKVTKHVIFDRFAKVSLWCIFPFRLLSESVTAAMYHNGGFLTQTIGDILPFANVYVEYTCWLLYSLALGVFFVSMPFSRYMHIFTEVFLIFFRRLGVKENEQKSGYTMYELSACSRCGICIDACPLNKQLDIKGVQSVYFLRDIRYKMLKDEIADNCLMCSRCASDCPVQIDLMAIRRQMRDKKELDTKNNYRYLDTVRAFNAMDRVVYFAGCMSHLTPGIPEAMEKIFETVGQKYWYMDKDATICCGRPLMQQGFHTQAADLRRKNTQLIVQSHATLLVTSCPICYQSFTKEYKLPIKVMHHTEYIAELIKSGKLKVSKDASLKVTYHDPCELGRGCGIYQEPRDVLNSVAMLMETPEEREHSLCCGFNLGNTVIELEQQEKIRNAALENLQAGNPDLICTACPMCKKAFTRATDAKVMDVAELVVNKIKN